MTKEHKIADAFFVRLSQRKNCRAMYTLVDVEDIPKVLCCYWFESKGYAETANRLYVPAHHKLLHRYIIKAERGQLVDHINGDGFDNRKQNLRIVTAAENARNRTRNRFPGKSSKFKGVCWDKFTGKWNAGIGLDGKSVHIGCFDSESEAAKAYDEAATRLHGEHARTNEMMGLYDSPDPFQQNCSYGPWGNAGSAPLVYQDFMCKRPYAQRLDRKLRADYAL